MFKEYTVNDIIDEIIDYRGKTPKKLGGNWSKVPTDYMALSAKNIKNGRIVQTDSIRFVSESMYKKWMKQEVDRGTILITSEAPFGELLYWDSDEKIVLSQRLFGLKIKKEFNARYIYYYMLSHTFQSELCGRATGSTVTGLRQPELLKCSIRIPKREIQDKIASILTRIDTKINLNTNINNNLYELMKNKFDNFIDNLDRYEESVLSKIANYKNGLAMQKYRPINELGLPVIKIREMNSGISTETERCKSDIDDEVIINNGDVLFAWSGTLCMSIWCGGKAGLNQHIFKVTSDKYPKWFYYFWTLKHLNKFIEIAAGKATTMGHIKRTELDKAIVKIPSDKSLEEANKIFTPLLNKYINNNIENRNLIQLRDTLLPKLMNGEINLNNIEI